MVESLLLDQSSHTQEPCRPEVSRRARRRSEAPGLDPVVDKEQAGLSGGRDYRSQVFQIVAGIGDDELRMRELVLEPDPVRPPMDVVRAGVHRVGQAEQSRRYRDDERGPIGPWRVQVIDPTGQHAGDVHTAGEEHEVLPEGLDRAITPRHHVDEQARVAQRAGQQKPPVVAADSPAVSAADVLRPGEEGQGIVVGRLEMLGRLGEDDDGEPGPLQSGQLTVYEGLAQRGKVPGIVGDPAPPRPERPGRAGGHQRPPGQASDERVVRVVHEAAPRPRQRRPRPSAKPRLLPPYRGDHNPDPQRVVQA